MKNRNATSNTIQKIYLGKALAVVLLSAYSLSLFSQKVEMVYSKFIGKPKTVQIEFCDSLGVINPSPAAFAQNDKVFFVVKPSTGQTWKLSVGDADSKVKDFKLNQSDKLIATLRSNVVMDGFDVGAAIISYPKSQIDITKPFKIRIKDVDSEELLVPEKLWPNYAIYSDLIKKAQTEYAAQNVSKSFFTLSELWSKDNYTSFLPAFSFYKSTVDSVNHLSDFLATATVKQLVKESNNLKTNNSDEQITKIHVLQTQYLNDIRVIDSFFVARSTEFDAKAKSATMATAKQSIVAEGKKADEYYVKKNLAIFETGNFQDYQYKIYAELLSKVITSVEKIAIINGFDSIPVSQIKKYPGIYKEMSDMAWDRNFRISCGLLNNNIKKDKCLFNEAAIANFANNKATEPQPYSLLFKAFNSLIKKDKTSFIDFISQSMATITDKELLLNLDLYLSLMNSNSTTNELFWESVQKGYEAQSNGTLQEAKALYEKAEKLSNTNEVLFLLMAQTNLKLNDRYSAEIYFKRANTINPKFILAKLYQIDFLTEDKDYETALNYTNEALATNQYWYFYYMKAQLLQLTGKNEDAKAILLNNCITINPLNYEEYLLLGDVYCNLNDLKNARENYMKAGNIKPNDIAYKKRMEALKLIPVKVVK